MPQLPGEDVITAERRARAVELRRLGKTFAAIGDDLGVTASRAYRIYQAALAAIPAQHLDEHRAEELQRLDYLTEKAFEVLHRHHITVSNGRAVMLKGEGGVETPVEDDAPVLTAIDRVLKISERRAKLLGLDAPARAEVTIDSIDAQIAELNRQLAGGVEVGEAPGGTPTSA